MAQVGVVLEDTDVSRLTPGRTPGVLHLPEVASVRAIAHGEYTVVDIVTTGTSENARAVELELVVHRHSDGHRLLRNSTLKGVHATRCHVREGGRRRLGVLGARALAAASLARGSGRVRVVGLSADTTSTLHVTKSTVHPAAVAAVVDLIAIHKILLREGPQGVVLQVVGTLDGARRGERPARATLTLVLDGSHGTLGYPINRVGVARLGLEAGTAHAQVLHGHTGAAKAEVLTELGPGHVGELVYSHFKAVRALVVLLDHVVVVRERLQALQELGTGEVVQAVLTDVVNKLAFVEITVT